MSSNKKTKFQELELAILREAVDKAQERKGQKIIKAPEIQEMIKIVENFLKMKKLICYGGTAINNILPADDQFYDKSVEIPDYDFFSHNALEDAKELADIYYSKGYTEVEAKAGQHYGTYKVFVDFIPVADITSLDKQIYTQLKKEAIMVGGIYYAPPNFLRMSMYLELSRPEGDTSRWEKVLKRLVLLNKNYPLRGKKCNEQEFQRSFENINDEDTDKIYNVTKQSFIDQGVVFFGGYASSIYGQYMHKSIREKIKKIPDFDVLSEDPETAAIIVKERLMDEGVKKVSIHQRKGVGEIIAPHYEVRIGLNTIAFIYKPTACHSYNTIHIKGNKIKIATIDTMLSFYLAFLYANRLYYDVNRILCMAQFLFTVQARNRLQQKGVLRRFSINCYGKQETREEIHAHKAQKHAELQSKKNTREYEEWFLRYVPAEKPKKKIENKIPKVERKDKKTKKNAKTKKAKKIKAVSKTKKRNFNKYMKKRAIDF